MPHSRDLKRTLREILSRQSGLSGLAGNGWAEGLAELDGVATRRLTGPLFSLLLDKSEVVRWGAVALFGRTVARMAEGQGEGEGLEAARVVLRQCLWRLNEESGGVGWGVPEALGETLFRHRRLALEFHRVLASYVREPEHGEGNSLDHVPLRRGVYWALGRLAQAHPDLLEGEITTLRAGLGEEDGPCRGLAAWALGILSAAGCARVRDAAPELASLKSDAAEVALFADGALRQTTVGALASGALGQLAGI
ncbi:MAG: HEAT repeat domain-containing protein [Humidesulfovibrio sp.]|nr:HEAT repeat domain-containing protein [Humidesulfovibrio sp.]